MTKTCITCATEQPLENFASHKQTKDRKYPTCRACQKVKSRKWAEANRERHAAQSKAWDAANPEKRKAVNTRWREANPDRMQAARRSWKAANPGANSSPEYLAAWRAANKARIAVYDRLRRHSLKQAFPAWADLDPINALYEQSARLSAITGTAHQVDHIVPLKSPLVCGLHVAHNLQILPAADNLRKGNRYWPGMP